MGSEFSASRSIDLIASQIVGLKDSIPEMEEISRILAAAGGVIVVTGVGKSSYVAAKFSSSLRSVSVRSIFVHPSEAHHGDMGFLAPGDVLVTVSSSGETKEIVPIIHRAKALSLTTIAILNRERSLISSLVDFPVVAKLERELDPLGILPTSSSVTCSVVLDIILCLVATQARYSEMKFASNHPGGSLGVTTTMTVEQVMEKLDSCALVRRGQDVSEVAEVMTKYPHGLAIVLDGADKFVGVVTDGDLRRGMLKTNFSPEDRIDNFISFSPVSCEYSESLHSARLKLESHKPLPVGAAPVFREGEVVGIVNLHHLNKGPF